MPGTSGAQGPLGTNPLGEDVPIHYACGISHVPLPGADAVTDRIKDLLLAGDSVVAGTSAGCPANGAAISLYRTDLAFERSATARSPQRAAAEPRIVSAQAAGEPMTLAEAEVAGLIQLLELGRQTIIVTEVATPVKLAFAADSFEAITTELDDGATPRTPPTTGRWRAKS